MALVASIPKCCRWFKFSLRRQCHSTQALNPLDSSKLTIMSKNPDQLKEKPTMDQLVFGKNFTDHMLRIRWSEASGGWEAPRIVPLETFRLHPGSKVLHYAQECFEGMKAFRGYDDRIRLFRPMHNMARLNVSAKRACLPTFNGLELLLCIRRLVQLESEWVPHYPSSSLYIRPTLIGTEPTLGIAAANEAELYVLLCPVGPYFSSTAKAVNLLADPKFVRAFPGGCGYSKMGCNYAPTLYTQSIAAKYGCHQCLWLLGENEEITEVGAMNIFIHLINEYGEKELVTPCLEKGIILPGITRRSIIELANARWTDDVIMSERTICMSELLEALKTGRLLEVFGAGTAAIVSPVGGIHYNGQMIDLPTPSDSISSKIMKTISGIYYGTEKHPWAVDMESWDVDGTQIAVDYELANEMLEN